MKIWNDLDIKFSLEKFKWYEYIQDNANKFTSNYHGWSIQIGWLKFTCADTNYNKIIHCILDEDEFYSKSQQHLINVLLATLKIMIVKETDMMEYESDYIKNSLPFSFRYRIKENGHLICYITGPKEWFSNHNLGAMSQGHYFPDVYMTKEQMTKYFPDWNNKKHNFERIIE